MSNIDLELQELLSLAKTQGFLTYKQVNSYLPDETTGTQRIDDLLAMLDRHDIELVDHPTEPKLAEQTDGMSAGDRSAILTEDLPKITDDPIRMYLSQMADIPLLSREEEIALAKKIEVARKRFRNNLLRSYHALEATVATLERVYRGDLPFDRTIKVSLTERLTKDQVLARMPPLPRCPAVRRRGSSFRSAFRQESVFSG